jgi:hypothetical protein
VVARASESHIFMPIHFDVTLRESRSNDHDRGPGLYQVLHFRNTVAYSGNVPKAKCFIA